jgi:hypothetical protein
MKAIHIQKFYYWLKENKSYTGHRDIEYDKIDVVKI